MRIEANRIHNRYNAFEELPVSDILVWELVRLLMHLVT